MPGMDFYSGAFSPDKIETEARTLNEKLIALCQKEFDTHNKWFDIGAEEYRKRRDGGETAFPKPILLARAKLLEVPSRDEGRPISLRCFVPKGQIHGIFLHIHGGGWVLSNAGSQDPYLERIADESGMIAASIEYRLAPEHPSPAAENDCFDVAHYLMSPQSMAVFAQDEKVRKNIVISGESAGAHLAASTMIALKHRHEQTFAAAILNYGVFDLSLTPSVRKTTVPLVLCRKDMEEYIKAYLPDKCHSLEALRSAEHSPLYADLAGLCPAIFNCGSVDCLLVRLPPLLRILCGTDLGKQELTSTRTTRYSWPDGIRRRATSARSRSTQVVLMVSQASRRAHARAWDARNVDPPFPKPAWALICAQARGTGFR